MKQMGLIILIFGILVLGGGIMGYQTVGSLGSLIGGSLSGALLILNSYWIFKGKESAVYVSLLLTFILDGFFTYRFLRYQKFFPAGIMTILSVIVIFLLVQGIRRTLKKT